jgi:hypothetical protein
MKLMWKHSVLAVLSLCLIACSKSDTKKMADDAKAAAHATKQAASDAADATKKSATEAADKTKRAATEAADATKDKTGDAADSTKSATGKAADPTKDAATAVGNDSKQMASDAYQCDCRRGEAGCPEVQGRNGRSCRRHQECRGETVSRQAEELESSWSGGRPRPPFNNFSRIVVQ